MLNIKAFSFPTIFATVSSSSLYSIEEPVNSLAEAEDNKRKANSADKYKVMAQRRPNIFRQPWARWMMRRNWGKKIMFFFFGKKKDKKNGWPAWVVKTDEERCQNMPWLFPGNPEERWIVTEKIDGSSTTFTMKGRGRKQERC